MKYKLVIDKDGNVIEKRQMTQEEINNPEPGVEISPNKFWRAMLDTEMPDSMRYIIGLRVKMLEEPENLTEEEKKIIKMYTGEEE